MKAIFILFIGLVLLSCRKDNLEQYDFGFTKIIGGNSNDQAQKVILINEALYVFGSSSSQNLYLLKFDLEGNLIFEKEYGDNTTLNGYDIIHSADNNLVLLGNSQNSISTDLIIKKVDLNGIEIWSTTIGGLDNELAGGVIETENNEFCIAATTRSYGVGNNDLYLIWLTQNGEVIREKTYGGSQSDGSTSILKSGTDLIVLGYTNSWGAGGQDYLLLKVNAVGDSLWAKTYGGAEYEESQGFVQTLTGGFIINGHSNSIDPNHNMFAVGVNQNGDVLWEQDFEGEKHDGGQAILQNNESEFVLVGRTKSLGNGTRDVIMLTVNEMGNIIKTRTIINESNDWIDDLIDHQGYYYMVGHTSKPNQTDTDVLLIKFKK